MLQTIVVWMADRAPDAKRRTPDEAELLASVRRRVAPAVGIEIGYTSATDAMRRYDELLAQRSPAPAADLPAQASFD
ncbi:hypothetical protein AWB80_04120 [Caballeronia pedi]|uniref:Uncharacterized protein n=1 Tax=Caballeronia pedi TaxID=1777141 RepID=A0A158BTY2_9BURK|nr:hypothetical protein [Caballeronia pedi]SAK73568.1 hypothetical protein AWB80_04120 [Caballeronia pedi]